MLSMQSYYKEIKMETDHQPRMVKPESVEKPKCKLVGENGNIFNLGAIASRALKKAGRHKTAKEMVNKMFSAENYDEALAIVQEYVDVS